MVVSNIFFIVCPFQAWYFDRDDIALHGFHNYFKKASEEEREHAEKLMKFQNQRGGRIVLQDIKVLVLFSLSCKVLHLCRSDSIYPFENALKLSAYATSGASCNRPWFFTYKCCGSPCVVASLSLHIIRHQV